MELEHFTVVIVTIFIIIVAIMTFNFTGRVTSPIDPCVRFHSEFNNSLKEVQSKSIGRLGDIMNYSVEIYCIDTEAECNSSLNTSLLIMTENDTLGLYNFTGKLSDSLPLLETGLYKFYLLKYCNVGDEIRSGKQYLFGFETYTDKDYTGMVTQISQTQIQFWDLISRWAILIISCIVTFVAGFLTGKKKYQPQYVGG